jgi:hypothetical protein
MRCSTISVTWTTGQDPPPQYVHFGTASGSYGPPVPATQAVTYTSNSICGTFGSVYSFIDPGVFFTANMTGLLPATKYYYRVGTLVSPMLSVSQCPAASGMHARMALCEGALHGKHQEQHVTSCVRCMRAVEPGDHQPGVLLHLAAPDGPSIVCEGGAGTLCGCCALLAYMETWLKRLLSMQVILSADMSVADNNGAILFGKSDSPLNTAAGMANEMQNNGYTLSLMSGDLAYADGYLSEHSH